MGCMVWQDAAGMVVTARHGMAGKAGYGTAGYGEVIHG